MGNRYDDEEELIRAVFERVKAQHRKEKKDMEFIDARAKAEWIAEAAKAFMSKGEWLPYALRERVVGMLAVAESDTYIMEGLSQDFGLSFGFEWEEYDVPHFQMVAEFLYVIFRYYPELSERVINATGDDEIYQLALEYAEYE